MYKARHINVLHLKVLCDSSSSNSLDNVCITKSNLTFHPVIICKWNTSKCAILASTLFLSRCCETLRRGGIVGNLASWEALERKSEDLNHPLLLFISGHVVEASLTSCIWRSIHLTLDWTLWIWVKTNHVLLFIRLFFSDIC